MKDSLLMQAMEHLDGAYIAEAAPTAAVPMKLLRRRLAMKWTSVAAGFCAALLLSWHLVSPYASNAVYRAKDIGNIFSSYTYDSVSTESYQEVFAPSVEELYISAVPSNEYIDVYEKKTAAKELDEAEFKAFTDGLMTRFSQALDIPLPSYEVKLYDATSFSRASLRADYDRDEELPYSLYASQDETRNRFSVFSYTPAGDITLNGIPLKVDLTLTDEEIIASLGDVKAQLLALFDVNFEDIKIVRQYNRYGEYGVGELFVYFYNAADHPLNEYMSRPVSDYIVLSFYDESSVYNDEISCSVLSNVDIYFYQYRTDDIYTVSNRVRMISVEQAEELLYKGYVFGGHSCNLCMQNQEKVDFEGYDYVGLTYVFEKEKDGLPAEGLPFYTFFKKLDRKVSNDNSMYAMTYVPAVEVKGYEAYFKKQQKMHRTS